MRTHQNQSSILAFIANDGLVLFTITSLATFAIFWQLGQSSLYDWDEAIHAQVAKEFIQGGDWLTPHWNYEPYFRKPPLSMWLTAIFLQIFGVNEFSARATSAFSGIGLVIITYLMGKLIYNRWVSLLAVFILLRSREFLYRSRFGTTDVFLTFLTFIGIYGYLRVCKDNQNWWYLIWIAYALGFMVKGPGAIIIPATIIVSVLLRRNYFEILHSQQFWLGALLALMIVMPWHIFMIVKHGSIFINEYFYSQIIARINSPLGGNKGNFLFYFPSLEYEFYLWSYLVPFALIISFRENMKLLNLSHILLVIFCLVFGGYSLLVQTKLPWYIFPIYPALSILVASLFVRAIKYPPPTFVFAGLIISFMLIAPAFGIKKIIMLLGLALFLSIVDPFADRKLVYQALVITICTILFIVGLGNVKHLYAKEQTAVAKLGILAGSKDPSRHKLLLILQSSDPELYDPALLFYSDRPVQPTYSFDEFSEYIEAGKVDEAILTQKDLKALKLTERYKIEIIAESKPLAYVRLTPTLTTK